MIPIQKNVSSCGQKITELKQFLLVPVDFSVILNFPKIAVSRFLAVVFKFTSRAQFWGRDLNIFYVSESYIFGVNHCLGHKPNFEKVGSGGRMI